MKKNKSTLFNRILKRLAKDNNGSGIVIVIIAMAMIGILATTIGWSSYVNFKIKMSDQRTKISFYEAEKAMEEIMAGIQNEAAIALRHSYDNVMKNWIYDEEASTFTHKTRFGRDYMEELWKYFAESADHGSFNYLASSESYCDMDILIKFVDDTTISKTVWKDYAGNTIDKVKVIYDPASGSLTLKDVGIEYTDDNGYVAKISTDYCISIPNLAFDAELPISEVLKGNYYLIGDKKIEVKGDHTLDLKCNAYAGEEGIKIGSAIVESSTGEFINRKKGNLVVADECTELLTKGPIELLEKNSTFTINKPISDDKPRSIYANSIVLNGGKFTVDDDADDVSLYVQDDLELRGSNSIVDLKSGKYYGYGNASSAEPADVASSIIINGTNSTLNLGVKKLLLAGTAYVGKHRTAAGEKYDFDPCRMGESITVKGGQIAYLAPAESIVLVTDDANETFIQNLGSNPVDYLNLSTKGSVKADCDLDKAIYKLNGNSLKNLNVADKRVFYDNASGLEYFYLVFRTDKDAKEYFKTYYGYSDELGFSKDSKTAIDTYIAMRYAQGGIKLDGAETANIEGSEYEYNISGNVFTYDPAGPVNNKVKLREYDYTADSDLIDSITEIRDEKFKVADIFDYLVDDAAMAKLSGPMEFESGGYKAIVTPLDYEVTDPDVMFVLSSGTVTIKRDKFEGCAFAKDAVVIDTSSHDVEIKPNALGIYEAINAYKVVDSEFTYSPLSFLKNRPIEVDKYGEMELNFSKIVRYVNWIKQ